MKRLAIIATMVLAACTTPAATPPPTPAPTVAPVTAAPSATPFFTTGSLREAMNAKYKADGKKVTIGLCLAQSPTTFVCSGSSFKTDPYGGADIPTAVTVMVTVGPDGSWIAQ